MDGRRGTLSGIPPLPEKPLQSLADFHDPGLARLREVLGILGYSDDDPDGRAAFVREPMANTNDVFIGRQVVIRISRESGDKSSLAREALLAGTIPTRTGYPAQIDSGVTSDGHAWIASEYIEGVRIGDVIFDLSDAEQRRVMHAIRRVLGAVHEGPPGHGPPRPQWPGNDHNDWLS